MHRILNIIESLDGSGAANQLGVLAPALAREGMDVHIAVLRADEASRRHALSIPVSPLGGRSAIDPLAFMRLVRLMRRFQPDVVQTWDIDSAVFAGGALARVPERWRDRVRAWGLSRRQPHLVVGLYRIEPWRNEWQWVVMQQVARYAERIVTSSRSVRAWYAKRGLPAEKFTAIPPGVPAALPSDVSRADLLRELQLPADARLIGVVDRLVPETRVKDLIWAADLLRVLHDNLRVLIIGDGPLRPELEEYARLASDLAHIQFLGNRSDLWRIMPHLDVLWNGSENVGSSVAILEAMAAGVPVVASDTPTNREIVVENETGFLIPLGLRAGRAARARHTDRIFTDAQLSARLGAAARQRVAEEFGAAQLMQHYGEMYGDLGIR